MARLDLTLADVIRQSGLNHRTVKKMLSGENGVPHARTLHQLAGGLGVSTDELFANPSLVARRLFDRRTNPAVDEVVAEHPDWFDGWVEEDFDELYSRFGHGGALTVEGAEATVLAMNRNRRVQKQVALLLETAEAELLCGIVDCMYRRVVVLDPEDARSATSAQKASPLN